MFKSSDTFMADSVGRINVMPHTHSVTVYGLIAGLKNKQTNKTTTLYVSIFDTQSTV